MSPGVQVALPGSDESKRDGLMEREDGIDGWGKGQKIFFLNVVRYSD